MISLSSLLNPVPSEAPDQHPHPRSHPSPTHSPSTSYSETETVSSVDRPVFSRIRARDSGRITKPARPRGLITYRPFEDLDEAAMREVSRFQVIPFGRIRDSCAHIPYNSGKKDFFDKTGRESFEVFKYDFRAPGDDNDYTIMWDYNIGLVRMTPFFKCFQYGKTMPAKMLNMNPGLKDITHSITGGAILAQGYWMPYSCAKAVCSTFCYKIASALIPIFGPSFPSICTRPDSPDYGRMVIDPSIIRDAAREAEANRRHHHAMHVPRGVHSATNSPRHGTPRSTPEGEHYQSNRAAFQHQARLGMYSRSSCTSPYNTDSDEGLRPLPDSAPGSRSPGGGGYLYTSAPARVNSGWTPANQAAPAHHFAEPAQMQPWASSVPRFAPPGGDPRLRPWRGHAGKRYVEEEVEWGYEGGAESQANSPEMGSAGKGEVGEGGQRGEGREGGEGAMKEGAMLLLGLAAKKGGVECAGRAVEESHRAKRRRDSPE